MICTICSQNTDSNCFSNSAFPEQIYKSWLKLKNQTIYCDRSHKILAGYLSYYPLPWLHFGLGDNPLILEYYYNIDDKQKVMASLYSDKGVICLLLHLPVIKVYGIPEVTRS